MIINKNHALPLVRLKKFQDRDKAAGVDRPALVDPLGRSITYLRVSVTDRCNLRCGYCMPETAAMLPKELILSFEELDRICDAFIALGVRKIRITGGEPLVRRDILSLFRALSVHLENDRVDEITLTTNGSRLARYAPDLRACGVKRVNVSLDAVDAATFRDITRGGDLDPVLKGISAAVGARMAVKINTVVLKGVNDHRVSDLVAWCGREGLDLTLIEVMPVGNALDDVRAAQYVPLTEIRQRLERDWTFRDLDDSTGGPATYVRVEETRRRLGFITPLTGNFCDGCNRVRLTCTGRLYLCLGQDDSADLRAVVRKSTDDAILRQAIHEAIAMKPHGHAFAIGERHGGYTVDRHMNATGG